MKKYNQVILGTLLGDASATRLYGRATSNGVTWEHGLKQKPYAIWKAKECGLKFYTYRRDRFDTRTNKTYKSFSVHLAKQRALNNYRSLFYKDGIKFISDEILNRINRRGIAIWYCDDGNLTMNKENNHLTLSVNCFTELEKERIIKFFKDRYGLNFKPSQKAIRLGNKKEIIRFMKLFGKYIPNCMRYKKI